MTDATIEFAVPHAQPMMLRGLLHQLTGDEDVIAMKPGTAAKFGTGRDTAREEDEEQLKAKAADFLKRHRDEGTPQLDIGPVDRLQRSLSLSARFDIPVEEYDIWLEELALDRWARGVQWAGLKAPSAGVISKSL